MTLLAAWVRNPSKTTELVIATDSRLTGGEVWDCCPKILPLSRSDAVLCFAGETSFAYPVMLQIGSYVNMYHKALSRAMDLHDLKGHLVRIVEQMRSAIRDLPQGVRSRVPEVRLLLAGYSWRTGSFKVWSLECDETGHIHARSVLREAGRRKRFVFVGDAAAIAKKNLIALLRHRGRFTKGGLDMEPFEVLRDLIQSGTHRSIGGAPQLIKLYPHMNYMPYNVLWSAGGPPAVTYLGRLLLDYETNGFLTLDAESLGVLRPDEVAALRPRGQEP